MDRYRIGRAACIAAIAGLMAACVTTQGEKPGGANTAPAPRPASPPPAPQKSASKAPAPAPAPVKVEPPPPPPKTAAELRLAEGQELYEAGDYRGTIRKLQTATELWAEDVPKETRIDGHKYLAFSLCVTSQRALCRRQFDSLLKLNPDYELSAAEAGHPGWGPVFVQAKKALTAPPPKPATPAVPKPVIPAAPKLPVPTTAPAR